MKALFSKLATAVLVSGFLAGSAIADGMVEDIPVEEAKPVVKKVVKKKVRKSTPRSCKEFPAHDRNDCACELMGERTKLSGKRGRDAMVEFIEVECNLKFLPEKQRKKLLTGKFTAH